MIKFLIQRPIAVLMAFLACVIIGFITLFTLPVSLLPDISIPQITVYIDGEDASSRELESTIVAPIRGQLAQTSNLAEIYSETNDGLAIIHLKFNFGVNTDLAFIEVNEKIDAAMNFIPKDATRPKVVKASATDVPILYLNMMPKDDSASKEEFLSMCKLANDVVKRRIEQLTEVAMADITGVPELMLQILPDMDKLTMCGLTITDIENTLLSNNLQSKNMVVRDGYCEYNIRISSQLRSVEDVQNIYLTTPSGIMQLSDLCSIDITPKREYGRNIVQGKRAVTLAIIKQSDENIDQMKDVLDETIEYFAEIYPDIEFSVTRNQTELLDYTISNLQKNLIFSFIFILILAVVFLGELRSAIVIIISMGISIVITFLMFYLFDVSINIISMSGLILAEGLMVDNALILTENIAQYRERGYTLNRACALATTEMITPMLSSALTTIAVFIPLVFMSGIAGAIFRDQAFSITAGLLVSYIVGIMLLPVIYMLFYRIGIRHYKSTDGYRGKWIEHFYTKGVDFVFAHKRLTLLFVLFMIPLLLFLFNSIHKEGMPKLTQTELIVHVDWNETIHIDENSKRIAQLMDGLTDRVEDHSVYVGVQNYILDSGNSLTPSESEVYIKSSADEIPKFISEIQKKLQYEYPSAIVNFKRPETLFEKIFDTDKAELIAKVQPVNRKNNPSFSELKEIEEQIIVKTNNALNNSVAFRPQLNIEIDQKRVLLYNVNYQNLLKTLQTAFRGNEISVLRSDQQYLPINITEDSKSINETILTTLIETNVDSIGCINYIPLSSIVSVVRSEDLKNIVADMNGEYIPFEFQQTNDTEEVITKVKDVISNHPDWDVDFTGSFFDNQEIINELIIILLISILLIYFILAAQFENFVQPLIVLMEIPINIVFALMTLWITGYSLNLMSLIGIIVSCGIVVNDSILKLDTMNQLRRTGIPLMDAIHTAGLRRIRPIIMTSLTTILAMIPVLFTSDIGSELQQPLAVTLIGSMFIGTLVSLFLIPLIYWFIYRKKEKNYETN